MKRVIILLTVVAVMAAVLAASALSAAARSYSVGPSFECIQAPCEEDPGPSGEEEFAVSEGGVIVY